MQILYLIECQDFYKIGVAYDFQRRLAELSTGNPFELNVAAVYAYDNAQVVEGALHQRFSSSRVRGEWFSLNEQDLQDFHVLCHGLGGVLMPFIPLVEEQEEIETVDVPPPAVDEIAELANSIQDQWRPDMSKSEVSRLLGKNYAGTVWVSKVNRVIDLLIFSSPARASDSDKE